MKITYLHGAVIGTAETLADIKLLLGMQSASQPKEVQVKGVQKRKRCPICGKKVKFIWEHTRYNHSNDSARKDTVDRAHAKFAAK